MHHWQIRLGIIGFFSSITLILGYQFIWENYIILPPWLRAVAAQVNVRLPQEQYAVFTPPTPKINLNQITNQVNEQRQAAGLEALNRNEDLNNVAELLLKSFAQDEYQIDQQNYTPVLQDHFETVGYAYLDAANLAIVGPMDTYEVMSAWQDEQAETLLNEAYTEIGLGLATPTIDEVPVGAVVAILAQPAPERSLPVDRTQVTTAQTEQLQADLAASAADPLRSIPDSEVLAALNQYRATHQVPQLVENQQLCTYAAQRAQDLQEFGGLDAHQGFRDDFQDGNIPEGIKQYPGGGIAENLASQYCINGTTGESFQAESGTALVEWCFDSSTAGHREAQLNPKFTAACVRHADHLYVVIFGE